MQRAAVARAPSPAICHPTKVLAGPSLIDIVVVQVKAVGPLRASIESFARAVSVVSAAVHASTPTES